MHTNMETPEEKISEPVESTEPKDEVLMGQPIGNYLTRLYIILTIILTSAWLFSFALNDLKLKSHEEDRTTAVIEVTIERITEQLNLRKKKIHLLAKDPSVANLLQSGDLEALNTHIEWTLKPEYRDLA